MPLVFAAMSAPVNTGVVATAKPPGISPVMSPYTTGRHAGLFHGGYWPSRLCSIQQSRYFLLEAAGRISKMSGHIYPGQPFPMDTAPTPTYQFGPFRLELSERRLTHEGRSIALRTKVFDTLRVLVEHSGRLLTKHELMHAIWPDTSVEENNLNHNISTLRRALGEQVTGQRYIETVPRVGYRFVADVSGLTAVAPV